MLKTDVENIVQDRPGILISTAKPSAYSIQHKRMLEQESDKQRINKLEADVSMMKDMLQQILNKVNE